MRNMGTGRRAWVAFVVVALTWLLPITSASAQLGGGRTVPVGVGRPGDHWASTLQYTYVGRAAQGSVYGYRVSFEAADGCRITLFWPRDRIDLRGDAPGFRLLRTQVTTGWLWYPDRLTARSLPAIHRWILEMEAYYARQADGAIAAAQGFATVAAVGALAPAARAAVPAARAAPTRVAPTAVTRGAPKLSTAARRAVRSTEGQLASHRAKLEAYKRNPFAFDNRGHLACNAGKPELQRRIIEGRIRHLENEITNFENRLRLLRAGRIVP